MMKLNMLRLSFILCLAAIGPALASPVAVDFSVLGINTVDITAVNNPAGVTLNGVTLRYDNFGNGVDFGQVDSSGIFGTAGGVLIFDFETPSRGLNFDFSLLGVSPSFSNPLFLSLTKNGGNDVANVSVPATFNPYDPADPTLGDGVGSVAYSGAMFDQAYLYFSPDAPYFSVANLAYTPVPMGDANGDGRVDVSDLGILAANYGTGGNANWEMGDFNRDNVVDVSDLGILAANYGYIDSQPSAVPEPATLLIMTLSGLAILGRRKR